MRVATIMMVFLAMVLPAAAQTVVDPSGHWEGSVKVMAREIGIVVDIGKNQDGSLKATFGQPDNGVKGLPISTISVDGRDIHFAVKGDASDPGLYDGTISEDGYTIAGDLRQMGYVLPFSLRWTAVAQFAEVPKNAAIGKDLEGTWNGVLEGQGVRTRLILKMANQADGTASGTVMSPDGSGVEIPIAMIQKGSLVSISVPSIDASFDATLDSESRLVGTWRQSSIAMPLTLQRVK